MKKESTLYTFLFALVICAACSSLLAVVSQGLRARKQLNEEMDVRKNILKAVRLKTPLPDDATAKQVMAVYRQKIEELVIDARGRVVAGRLLEEIQERGPFYPLYLYKENGKVLAYCFPVYGKGLWSVIYGYLALESDVVTIRGISFYKDGETPGLGGEVGSDWFQRQFQGKKIYDTADRRVREFRVVKGKAADQVSGRAAEFAVDGITGATLTSKGVQILLNKWIGVYEPYLAKAQKGRKVTGSQGHM